MPAQLTIDGVVHTLEKLDSGYIRVSYVSPQFNPMHGPGTAGEMYFLVHPCQRNQYEYFNSSLPASERALPSGVSIDDRPWWSAGAGQGESLRE